ncbi:MAG: hypothetical protein KGJ78_07755 [Alphaproteobacteria bacterium]|nr:hypothetical protein [Alphaproteobacteria bacterium]
MRIQKLLMTAVAAALLTTTGAGMAMADPPNRSGYGDMHRDRGHDNHWRGDWRGHNDRYWRPGYHGTIDRDRIYVTLRDHHYYRWQGSPYWYQGRYVVRTYDRWGHVVFVEVNPYTGGFVGVIRF